MTSVLRLSFLVSLFIIFVLYFAPSTFAESYCGTGGCFTYDSDTRASSCADLSGPTTTTDLTPCIDELDPYQNTCCRNGGGCTALGDQSTLNQWDWNYASGCEAKPTISGECGFKFQYKTQTCGATDSCIVQPTGSKGPYLNPGQCSDNGCTTGPTIYKTCCYSNGNADDSCRGDQFTGTCPSNTTTVICGVGSCSGINATCTTAACGNAACLAIFPQVTCTEGTHFTQCGQSGTPGNCLNNYADDHTIEVAPSSCSNNTTTYACVRDLGRRTGECGNPTPPTLNTFSEDSTDNCYAPPYEASLTWSGTSLPSDDSCANGFWVDISTDSNFSSYYNKCVPNNSLSTNAPVGFGRSTDGAPLKFEKGQRYYARVFNNSPDNGGHSNTKEISPNSPVPSQDCLSNCNLATPSCNTDTKVCTFNNYTYSYNSTNQSNFQARLNFGDGNAPTAWETITSTKPSFTHTYTGNQVYTAVLEAKKIDGSALATCQANTPNFTQPVADPTCTLNTDKTTVSKLSNGSWDIVKLSGTTANMNGGILWYYTPGTCEFGSCPGDGWSPLSPYPLPGPITNPYSFSNFTFNPNQHGPQPGSTHTIGIGTNASRSELANCLKNITFAPDAAPGLAVCTALTASPTCNPTQCPIGQSVNLTAQINLSVIPEPAFSAKKAQWDCNGDGNFEITNDSTTNPCTYPIANSYNPSFRVIDSTKQPGNQGYLLSNTCSTTVGIGTQAQPPPQTPTSCTLSVSPSSQAPGGLVYATITSGPSGTYTVTCPDTDTGGGFGGSNTRTGDKSSNFACPMPSSPGTYFISATGPNNVSCSAPVTVATSGGLLCTVLSSKGPVVAYAFNDPNPITAPTTVYAWNPNGDSCEDSEGVSTNRTPSQENKSNNPQPAENNNESIFDKIKSTLYKLISFEKTQIPAIIKAAVNCNDPAAITDSCCGLTNIEGKTCRQGACTQSISSYPTLNSLTQSSVTTSPSFTALPGVTIHVDSNVCFFNYTQTTNQNGVAYFPSLPAEVGQLSSNGSCTSNCTDVIYTVWTSTTGPNNTSFSQGSCYYGLGSAIYGTSRVNNASCQGGFNTANASNVFFSSFGFSAGSSDTPWIKTRDGDVHSNTGIITPGGP